MGEREAALRPQIEAEPEIALEAEPEIAREIEPEIAHEIEIETADEIEIEIGRSDTLLPRRSGNRSHAQREMWGSPSPSR